MSMDLQRFHATYFEESREGLDAMESGLLALEGGSVDPEVVNSVFRAAHSIKGGAATFGFGKMAGLTHVLETLLDEVRGGKRALDAYKGVPILMLTTESHTEKKMEGKAAGATGWLVKPFDPEQLLATVKRVLG